MALAEEQHGVVTRAQLMELGLSKGAVERRLRAGRLRARHGGVYLIGPIESPRAVEIAAVLAGGPGAALSHTSALCLWGLHRAGTPGLVHVTVPGSGRRGRPGIVFHRARALAEDERAVVDRVPVTAPGRTIADAAGLLGTRELEQVLSVAVREGLIGSDAAARLPDRYAGRPGMASLRAVARLEAGPHFTRSEAERRCLDLLAQAGLPRPHSNVPVGPYELDLFWPGEGVAIEIDGWQHHASRGRFEGDRRKDAWLRGRGIQVIRLTWRQLTRDAVATVVQVGQALALAAARQRERVATARGGSA
jgi:very-short-patch-repair endonuclease